MRVDALRVGMTFLIAILILVGGFYALVIYPYELAELVKGAIIGFMGMAVNFVFGSDVAKTTAAATTKALMTSAPEQTVTVSAGPPATATVTPQPTGDTP